MKALVVIPTYNEAETIQSIVERVLAQDPALDVLLGKSTMSAGIVIEAAGYLARAWWQGFHVVRSRTRVASVLVGNPVDSCQPVGHGHLGNG